jgi:putative transposase
VTGLSADWARLGIHHERIEPGQPQQNGRHERFHLTLKEAMQSPETTRVKQQRRFDRFRNDYNNERPHEALGHKTPAQFYEASPRSLPSKTPEPDYPAGSTIRKVRQNGEIKWHGQKICISTLIAGDPVALTEVDNDLWTVQFYNRPIGILDAKTNTLTRMKKHQQKGDAIQPNL